MKAILEGPAKITKKMNWQRKNRGIDGEFIRKKISLFFYLNNTEEGEARSKIKMVNCQDKDNKSCRF